MEALELRDGTTNAKVIQQAEVVAGLACNFFQYDHSLMNVMKIMNTLKR